MTDKDYCRGKPPLLEMARSISLITPIVIDIPVIIFSK